MSFLQSNHCAGATNAPRIIYGSIPRMRAKCDRRTSGLAPTWQMISAAARLPRRPHFSSDFPAPGHRGSRLRTCRRHRWCRPRCDGSAAIVVASSLPEDNRALVAAGQTRRVGHLPTSAHGLVEDLGLIQRADLGFVGEHDVDARADQFQEFRRDAARRRRIRQRERHPPAGPLAMSAPGGTPPSLRPIEQITLQIHDLAIPDESPDRPRRDRGRC